VAGRLLAVVVVFRTILELPRETAGDERGSFVSKVQPVNARDASRTSTSV
jgi:hypothetical protein